MESDSTEPLNGTALSTSHSAALLLLPEGSPEKKQALFELCRCFHPYLMKYLSIIRCAHVPEYNGNVNKDAREFIPVWAYFPPYRPKSHKSLQ